MDFVTNTTKFILKLQVYDFQTVNVEIN